MFQKGRQHPAYSRRTRPLWGRFLGLATLALGCLLLGTAAGCAKQQQEEEPPPAPIVISEAVSSNKLSYPHEALGSPDWVELYNRSDQAVDLSHYVLTDRQDGYEPHALPNLQLPAGGYAVFYGKTDGETDEYTLPFGLSKAGDSLCLLGDGVLLERVVLPALPQDVSYARRADGSFGYCRLPTPGGPNEGEILDQCPEGSALTAPGPAAEPVPADSAVELILNEVVSNDLPDGPFGGLDWIELYNPGSEPVSVEGFYLSDRADRADKAALPAITVPAGGYAAIPCGQGEGRIPLGVSSAGETLTLCDTDLSKVDSLRVPALLAGQSWARDGGGAFGYCGAPTPGAENPEGSMGDEPLTAADEREPLRVSEVLFRNGCTLLDSYGDSPDYVELYNAGSAPVDLGEYYLSDDFSQPLRWRCPDVAVAPGAYALILLSDRPSTDAELHAPLALSAGDDGLQLCHRASRAVQRVPWPDDLPRDVSLGLGADGAVCCFAYPTPGGPNAPVADLARLPAYPVGDLHISEVSAAGEGGDWIELKNGSSEALSLDGWYLTDSRERERRQPLSGDLGPGAYLLITPEAFGVAAAGETLYLYDGQGYLRDRFETGALDGTVTSGRPADGTLERVFFLKATPGAANESDYALGRSPAPIASEVGLYHSEAFLLELSCADPAAVIRYTLDGSAPTASSPAYTKPLSVSRSAALRAVAQREGYLVSQEAVATYLFAAPHTLPVVTVACDPGQFRIFTQLKSIGRYPHTDARIAFYEADGTLGTAFPADINPRGNQSIKYPQKSLSIHLRNRLGQGSVSYPFWGRGTGLEYGTLILRNGSQDYTKARLRDSFALRAVEKLGLDSARTRPVVVYVNGEYYGIMDLNEGMNQDYLVTHFHVDPATVSHVSTNSTVRYGQNSDFLRVRAYARGNLFSDDKVLETFSQWVDVDYITDYLVAQTLFCNYDIKNQSYWATSDYAIRWRPVFYDIDRCFTDGSANRNLFSGYFSKKGVTYDKASGRVANMDLYANIRDNPGWCQKFLRRYAQLLVTDFSVERLQGLLDEMADALRPEMARHIARFRAPGSLEEWEANVASMRAEIPRRHQVVQEQLCKEFHLTAAQWEALLAEAKQAN